MDAWEILIDDSTIISGDAWEHLQAQSAGTNQIIYVNGGIDGTITEGILEATMEVMELSGAIEEVGSLSGVMDEVEMTGTIALVDLDGTLEQSELSGEI